MAIWGRRRRYGRIPTKWAIGIGVIWLLWSTVLIIESLTWERTKGRITTARTERRRSSGKTRTRYIVEYEYKAGYTSYTGDRVYRGLGDLGLLPSRRYRVNQEVPVYYDAASPDRAVLARRYSPGEVLVFVGILIGAIFERTKRKETGAVPSAE